VHTVCSGPKKTSAEVPNQSKGEMCSNYSLSICPYVSATIHRPARGAGSASTALPDLQLWHLLEVHRLRFLTLMVGAPGSPAPAPLGGPSSTFLSVNGGCFWITSSSTSQGAAINVSYHSFMVDALGPPAPAPLGGMSSTFLSIDDGRSQTSRGSTVDVS
jgi:hypothetical protein